MKRLVIACLSLISFLCTPVMAEKHLIFFDGYLGWFNSMPPYMVENHIALENLPFSGFVVVGNVYTSYVMSADPNRNNVTYNRVWNEVSSLQNVFQVKTDNFLRINLDFPGDFWDDAVWQKTTRNFAAVAKAAKNIGFKGILFDDEAYTGGQHALAYYMSNFKFPKRADVQANPEQYEQWEIDESLTNRGDWIDYNCTINGIKEENSERCAYRNPDYNFKEHMDKVSSRFKDIMQVMETEFPGITVLVLHGPATAHAKTNIREHYIKPNSLFQTNEYKGAMFLGFKEGLTGNASLHDFGEFYSYSTDTHFQDSYQWRKQGIADQEYNSDLDDSYHWIIPADQRADWSNKVSVGFMISDYGQPYNARGDYNTAGLCTPVDVEDRFTKAFNTTDDYVIFYSDSRLSECEADIRWQDVSTPVKPAWLNMAQRVYDSIQSSLTISAISTNTITQNSAMVFWDVSDYATGQVEYGKTTAYGNFNTKEISFNYDHHEQVLGNLEPGTLYHYRVISEDQQGREVISDDHTFSTLPELCSSSVLNLPSDQWFQISLPCTLPNNAQTVEAVFADDLNGIYGTDWVIYSFDSTANAYIDVGLNGNLIQGLGYWVFHSNGSVAALDLPANSTQTQTTPSSPCISANGCYSIPLTAQSARAVWNMSGYPFANNVALNRWRVVTISGACVNGCTLDQAKTNNITDNILWHYSGSAYEKLQGNTVINPWSGFWIAVLTGAGSLEPRLEIPVD